MTPSSWLLVIWMNVGPPIVLGDYTWLTDCRSAGRDWVVQVGQWGSNGKFACIPKFK